MDKLEAVISMALTDIPIYCTDAVATHEWAITYLNPVECWPNESLSGPTKMQPYYRCKHCHAVSADWTTNRYPKRVR